MQMFVVFCFPYFPFKLKKKDPKKAYLMQHMAAFDANTTTREMFTAIKDADHGIYKYWILCYLHADGEYI